MTSRSRSLLFWLIATATASAPSATEAQDTPLYRDPNPSEGPRITQPLLPAIPPRPDPAPPPSTLGPFQPSNPGLAAPGAGPGPEIPREPLLVVPPMPPPLPAIPMATMGPVGGVEFRRKTTIRPPNGPLGQCHERLRASLFGPPRPPTPSDAPRRGLFAWCFHQSTDEGDPPRRLFRFTWPTWPLADGS